MNLTRRDVLRAAFAAVALAACGKTIKVSGNRTTYVLDIAGTSPPAGDLVRLVGERARATDMNPVVTVGGSLGLPALVAQQTALGEFDPALNRRPPVNPVAAVAAIDPVALEPALATALKHGVKVVTYPVALRHRTAAVSWDIARAATILAKQAAGSAAGDVLLVLPGAAARGLNPYAGSGPAIEAAVRAALPAARIVTAEGVFPSGGQSAVASHRGISTVLVWDDDAALGAAAALRARDGGYVGALGAPAVTSRATFAELRRGDVLRAVVAARPRDLANGLVDLPRRLLDGSPAKDLRLTPVTLTPGSPELAAYERDYAAQPATTNYQNTPLNPGAQRS